MKPSVPPTLALAILAALLPLLLLAGCGPCGNGGGHSGFSKERTASRRMSEFDFYCSLRPPRADAPRSAKDAELAPAFAPAVYAAMKARGYKVHLVTYAWERPADPFLPVSGGLPGGYGLRNFFGSPALDTAASLTAFRSAETNANTRGAGRAGYGLRHFFGFDDPAGAPRTGTRSAVVWETQRGEFFLVDSYYSSPVWLGGADWLEKVRFYDPAAVSVKLVKS